MIGIAELFLVFVSEPKSASFVFGLFAGAYCLSSAVTVIVLTFRRFETDSQDVYSTKVPGVVALVLPLALIQVVFMLIFGAVGLNGVPSKVIFLLLLWAALTILQWLGIRIIYIRKGALKSRVSEGK